MTCVLYPPGGAHAINLAHARQLFAVDVDGDDLCEVKVDFTGRYRPNDWDLSEYPTVFSGTRAACVKFVKAMAARIGSLPRVNVDVPNQRGEM